MLLEQINLCEEAVDYFRASSALLKAGVAAGLTLYDIAILCCRNDNLAEEPSMMEKLFDMASELAHRAVESNRWHHTAASRALVEQLCPHVRRRSSLIEAALEGRRSFHRSISNAETASNSSSPPVSDRKLLRAAKGSPGMAQSSGSDSSSNNGDVAEEKEECEEWAAEIIANVTEHQMSPIKIRASRSPSVSSDDASSDSNESPQGFWRTAPGSVLAADSDGDDDSVDWSPVSTPREGFFLMNPPASLSAPLGKENNTDIKRPTVTFAESPESFSPPSVVKYKTPITEKDTDLPAPPITDGGYVMTRSKSYTALSAVAGKTKTNNVSSSSTSMAQDFDNYRKYFHKFIDLVIVRETTAALHHSRHGEEHKY